MMRRDELQVSYDWAFVTGVDWICGVRGISAGQGVVPFSCELATGRNIDDGGRQGRDEWVDATVANKIWRDKMSQINE